MVAQQSQSWRMGKPLFIKRRQISLKYHRNAWHIEAIDGTIFYGLLADKLTKRAVDRTREEFRSH